MTTPENTSARDPLSHFMGLLGGSDRYITGMEAEGQRQLVESDVLPVNGPWDQLEALGFIPGDPVDGDDLFRHVTLPDGWKREGTDHDMWSRIVDERGVERVAVFYKAAFYDRRASVSISNVGQRLASEAIYGDDEPALPEPWDVLTDDERGQYVRGLDDYLDQAKDHPTIYGDRVPKVRRLRTLAS